MRFLNGRKKVGAFHRPANPTITLEALEKRLQFHGNGADHDHLIREWATADVPAIEAPLETAPISDEVEATPTRLLPDLTPWADRQKDYVYGWKLDHTEKPGRVLLRLTTAMANIGTGPMELVGGAITRDGQEVSQRIFNSDGTHEDRLAGVFIHHPEHDHVHFNDFAIYRLREVQPDGSVGKILRAGKKISFCLTDSDRYVPAVEGRPDTAVYVDCEGTRQGISSGWADVYSQLLPDQWIDVTGIKGGKYWIEIVVDPRNHLVESDERNNVLRTRITLRPPVAPDNDRFANREVLSGQQINVEGNNSGATLESGEPRHARVEGGASVWYSWRAPVSGRVEIDTAGSASDTVLAVYTGSNLKKLLEIESNDDAPGGKLRTSQLEFEASEGVEYQIAIDAFQGKGGKVKLNLTFIGGRNDGT